MTSRKKTLQYQIKNIRFSLYDIKEKNTTIPNKKHPTAKSYMISMKKNTTISNEKHPTVKSMKRNINEKKTTKKSMKKRQLTVEKIKKQVTYHIHINIYTISRVYVDVIFIDFTDGHSFD